uniref:Dpy-19-like 1, like (H. sapiens) n=1 Tax=Fundulus heteroclitus TaxID=8078 RepID=A0A3Q2UG00_FUNHE
MVAKTRKQTGKSPGQTPTERDRNLHHVSPHSKSNIRRPGRESKAFSHPNGLSVIGHKLGLTSSSLWKLGVTILLGEYHLSQLFENDRHFSHLSNLEKEMAFRTEMGLYYSYYKTIIKAPSFLDGLHMIMNDRLTEYPLVINTLKRFNLYPEVSLSKVSALFVFQVASLFASYILGYLVAAKMQSILVTHMITLGVCFILMFGNSMLLTSFYASSLISIWVIIALRDRFIQVFKPGVVIWVMQGLAWVGSTVLLKFLLSTVFGASDDAHISGLIKSKFTSYKDFHTLMYTCAAEFDFMEFETPVRYLKTLLLPINLLVVALVAARVILVFLKFPKQKLVYHSLQLVAFTVLAILIMRLKLFLTPHMCIMASLVCSRQLFGWVGEKFRHQAVVFGLVAMMAVQGVANLQAQWAIIGEFSNLPQEELLNWIQESTRPDSVFAGAMPTMASVKLSTGRPIVNHPHYEDAGLRSRTKLVYSMYSRMSGEAVKQNLMTLGVDFFILEDSWCTRRTRPGCSMPEIWDVENPENVGKIPFCTHLSRNSRPYFNTVFSNDIYKVLKFSKDLR